MMSGIPVLEILTSMGTKIQDAVGGVTTDPVDDYTRFVEECNTQARALLAAVPEVSSWVDDVRGFGLGVLRGMPMKYALPATPADHDEAPPLPYADRLVGLLAASFGQLYVLADKRLKGHIHDVYFIERDANTQLGSGNSFLHWHVEDACHPTRPDWVLLYCLRGAKGVTTFFARLEDMVFQGDLAEDVAHVKVPLYLDESFTTATGQAGPAFASPIVVQGDQGEREILFDPAFTDASDPQVAQLIQAVADEADRVKLAWTLAEGELLIFNNRALIHGRSAFNSESADRQRWIKRALITERPAECDWVAPGVVANG